MDERRVADAARLERPDLKVLFITSYAEEAVAGNGHLEKGESLSTKPFAMAELGLKIGKMLTWLRWEHRLLAVDALGAPLQPKRKFP